MKPIKRALNKQLNSTPADSAVTTASAVLSAEVTTAAESSVAMTEDEMFDKESAFAVLAVLAPAVAATSAMGISTAGPAEPAKAPDPGRNVPASHRGGTVRPAPKSPAACDGRSLGDPTYTAPSRQEKIKLGSNEETQSNGRTMATHSPTSMQAHTMNLHVPTSWEDKARCHGSFGRGNPNGKDSLSRAMSRATLEATLEAKLRAAEASRRGLQDARARRQGLRDGQGEASRASAEADRLYSKVTAHLELHLEQHPQLKFEAQRKAKAEAKAKAKAKAEAKVAAGSARQSVSESSDDELPVARAVEWPEATPTVLALSHSRRRSESSKSSPCYDTCMAKTGVGCEWVAMYQDRAEQIDGAPRAVAGLAADDNRAKAHGEVAWSGPVREEAMRFHNKFVNLHDDAEGRSSFNPIAHVEVCGNQSLEVRRRVLREEERYAVREHQEPERHAAQPSAWMPKKAKPEQLAHSRSAPVNAPVESVQRGSSVASTAKAVGEPMHQSHGTRGGVAGPHYYTSHHALDNRLMPQRMPVVGYAGHLRRTKESSDYFGTSKWRPFSPPSRAQL